MPVLILYPNAVSVNDFMIFDAATADEAVRYYGYAFILAEDPPTKRALFHFDNHTVEEGTVNSVTLHLFGRWWVSQYLQINADSQLITTPDESGRWYTFTSPSAFTWADVDNVVAGLVASNGIPYDIRIDAMYLSVNYTPSASSITIVADPIVVTLLQQGSYQTWPAPPRDPVLDQWLDVGEFYDPPGGSAVYYHLPGITLLTVSILGIWSNLTLVASPIIVTLSQLGTGNINGEMWNVVSDPIVVTITMGGGGEYTSPIIILTPYKSNWLKWSNIGELDFTIWRDNVAGERPVDWKGWIYAIKKLGNKVAVYGQSGISLLTPAGNAFGFQTVHNLGLASKQAIVGTDSIHYFIDSENRLCKFDSTIEILDYSEYLASLLYPVMSLDLQTGLVYICDGVKGFVYNPTDKSLGSGPVNVTGIVGQVGVQYVVAPAAIAAPGPFEICTDIYDMGSRWGKTIKTVEIGTNIVTPISVCIDYRVNKNAAFLQTRWRVVNHRGFAHLPCYGNEFRFRVKASSYEYFELDYIKVIGAIHDN